MTSYLFIDDIWPEFAELLATRPIMIHEFHSTGMDCSNNTFLKVYFKVRSAAKRHLAQKKIS